VTDPLARFAADRARARAAGDPWADLCVLATYSGTGTDARTLVLRDVDARPAVFTNATSPKHAQFSTYPDIAVLVYLASVGVQYRMNGVLEPIQRHVVHHHWRARPRIPKVMDWLYREHAPQSAAVPSREALEAAHDALHRRLGEDLHAPEEATGHYIVARVIERLELARDRIHDRVRYRLDGDAWRHEILVP
jgi:pyridoxamine 5'-phosphate oxidase